MMIVLLHIASRSSRWLQDLQSCSLFLSFSYSNQFGSGIYHRDIFLAHAMQLEHNTPWPQYVPQFYFRLDCSSCPGIPLNPYSFQEQVTRFSHTSRSFFNALPSVCGPPGLKAPWSAKFPHGMSCCKFCLSVSLGLASFDLTIWRAKIVIICNYATICLGLGHPRPAKIESREVFCSCCI